MVILKNKNLINKFVFLILVIILIFQTFKLPYNFYFIKNRDYNSRMVISHGYCEKDSYGFIKETLEKFKILDSFPIRKIYYPTPGLEGLLKKTKVKYNDKYLFLLNFAENENFNLENLKQKTFIVKDFSIDLSEYYLAKRSGNCFFWIKND